MSCGLLLAASAVQAELPLATLIDEATAMAPAKGMEKVLPQARKDWEGVIGTLVQKSRGSGAAAENADKMLRIIFDRTELAKGAPHYGVQWGFFLHEDKQGTLNALPYAERLFDGPAKKAGLRRGETALAIDGISLARPDAPHFLRQYLRMSQPGATVELTLKASSIGKNPGAVWSDKNAKKRKLRIKLGPARTKPERGAHPGEFEAWKATYLAPHVLQE